MNRSVLALLSTTLLYASAVAAQEHSDLSKIDETNRLGRMLYAYDQAAWHGTDAVMSLLQADGERVQERVQGYVAEPEGSGWRVSFGRLSADSSAFAVAYEARLDSVYAMVGAQSHPEPIDRTGFPLDAARALAAVAPRFSPPEMVRYNTAVLPAPGGRVYVYHLPAQPAVGMYYVGGDVRYTYDPVTHDVIDEKPLHQTLFTFDLRDHPDAITMSSAVLTDGPTETDVFYALSRPSRPEEEGASHYVTTDEEVFLLNHSGIILSMSKEAWERMSRELENRRNP